MRKNIFIAMILMVLCTSLQSKDWQTRCRGTYSYTYSENISHAEAKARAIENAVVMALANEFGTTVTAQSQIEVIGTSDRFDMMSNLQVKGKLLRHIVAPVVSAPLYADNMFTVNVTVDFYAIPIKYAPTEFSAKTLRNGREDKFASSDFVGGDKFFMSFISPKAGALAVFFDDRNTVSCMLPYVGDDEQAFAVAKDVRYVLFDIADNTYHMSCGAEPEINYIHIVFSPNQFVNADLVRTMSHKQFNKWLDRHRSYDSEMQVETKIIRVMPTEN